MSTHDSSALLAVRSTAVVGLGVATGLMASYPLFSWPAMYSADSPLDVKGRLNLFWHLYSQGAKTMKALLPSLSALLAYASFATREPASYLPATFIGRHRKAVLGTAAVLVLANLPYTIALIMPTNNRLKAIKDAKTSGAGAEAATTDAEVNQLIRKRWMSLHFGRILLCGTAFLLSVAELGTA
ncbi:hypothetical protein JCM10908_006049 [Rhodotorula pacifica]|uniref:DUF1772 domain-containing protein n=1 Tax=Rhodotorula pacifica TaxID=1495444 RepID=UPI0031793455